MTLGINPLNWTTTDTYADKSLNKGAVFTDYDGKVIKAVPAFTGAYLDKKRGTLKVINVNTIDYPPVLDVFQPGVFHMYDYLFFYQKKCFLKNSIFRVERKKRPKKIVFYFCGFVF